MGWFIPFRSCPIYIDRAVIVVNKPPGVVCQLRDDKFRYGESFNKLVAEVKERFNLPEVPWPIHRLDKDTTGALLLARSRQQAREFHVQFQQREIGKTYLALVHAGEGAFGAASGTVRNVLVHDFDGRFQRVMPMRADVREGKDTGGSARRVRVVGKTTEAITHWKLLGSSPKVPISLVSLELETGAKHQLRIHLSKVLNAPVLGDPLYSSDPHLSNLPGIGVQRGLYLHASHVAFYSYRQLGAHKRFRIGVTAPLPPSFVQACQKLKIPLADELISGGVHINSIRQDVSLLREGAETENGMRWLL